MERSTRLHAPLMLLAISMLLAAAWGGLIRIGWAWPLLHPPLLVGHGPLMVSGFLGTLICLERAAALRRPWAYAAPLFTAAGPALLVGGSRWAGPTLTTVGSALLVAIFVVILRQHAALFTLTMAFGSLAWLIGNLLWLAGWSVPHIVLWWMGFLVITIVGERIELGRLLQRTVRHYLMLGGALGLFAAGMVVSL